MKKKVSIIIILIIAAIVFLLAFTRSSIKKETTTTQIDWPKKNINIVVGYTAGGDSDLNARLVAKYLGPVLGTNVIVTNVNGSSGMVAAAEVADANPDGYRVYWGHGGVNVTQAYGGASVDMFKDFVISSAILTDNAYTLCVAASTGIKNYNELKKYCVEKPESLVIVANAKSGNWYTVTGIEKAGGMKFKKIEAAGAIADRIVRMLAGEQQLIYSNYKQLSPYIENHTLNVIGTISEKRSKKYPALPTLTELGCPVKSHYIFGFRFPKGTDKAIVAKFENALKKVSQDPKFIAEAEGYGVDVTYMTGQEYTAISQEIYDRAVKSLNK
ncbi:MAG: Bug family tripartite tricarboxylate transporter substrate binding protein [Pyramidobacter sp.]|jgi:tripartite-type tricarboxylate transporter receptor subunit TctC